MPAKDTIIYASYNVNKYHVTFYDNDSTTILKDVYADYGSVVVAPTAPAKEGREFVNWGVDEVPAKVIAKDTNLYANYKVLDYTITFKNYNDTVLVAYTLPYGSEVVNVPNVPARTGYTFNGWREAVPATIPAKDVVCKAQFSINQYTVSFFNADGTLIVMTLGDYGNSLQEPSKNMVKVAEGYSFVGWNEVLPATIPACDTSFYAVLERNDYVITFQDYDKSVIQRDTLKFEDRIVVPTVNAREGYTFTGWDKEVPATVPSSNLTFTAKYTINKHNVVFKDFDESVIAQQTVTYGESISEPTVSRTGYTFIGWDKEVPASMPDSSLEFIAQYTVNRYELVFEDEDGNEIKRDTLDYGDTIVPPADPEKEGYDFVEWKDLPETMIDEDIVVRPEWREQDIEFTLEDMEALLSRHCEGEEVQVSYSYTSGKPLSYKFYFSEEAVAAGFPSEQSGELGENGELYLNIPMGVDKGEYGVELQFFGKEKESGKTAFTVSTNISSSRLLKMWDDVVVCNNADNMFVSYQWYKDGEEIDGANGQYYCELGGLEGDYSVKVVTVDGEELFVCKKHFDRVEPPFSIAVYPNPAKANEDFTLEVKGLTEEEFASARIFVYTANGVLAYSTKRVSDRNSISLPVGEYVALVVLEGRSAYCKVLVR
jgi:hypothetical protein